MPVPRDVVELFDVVHFNFPSLGNSAGINSEGAVSVPRLAPAYCPESSTAQAGAWASLDDFVGAREQRLGKAGAERFRSLRIEHED
jgi:hypothetical protein